MEPLLTWIVERLGIDVHADCLEVWKAGVAAIKAGELDLDDFDAP
jgi:hypothetical protein